MFLAPFLHEDSLDTFYSPAYNIIIMKTLFAKITIRRRLFLLWAVVLWGVLLFPGRVQAQVSAGVERSLREAGIGVFKQPRKAPDFDLPLLAGGTASLSAQQGKVVILNFWATWCPPCREEMPSMETFYRRFKDQGLEIFAVDGGEDTATVQRFIRQNGYTFPILLDRNNRVNSNYGITAIPSSFILDRSGNIVAMVMGSKRWDDPKVIAAFTALLKGE